MWHAFLCRRIMSVGHTSEVQKDRTVVVYALITNIPINMGKLIFSQLSSRINNNNMGMFFLKIITELCAAAKVVYEEDDECL